MTLAITLALITIFLAIATAPKMASSYIPAKDADLDAWAINAQSVLSAAPTSYGLSSGQVSAFATLRVAFTNALATATNPGTRTSVTVAAKDTAKANMVFSIRQLAQIAQNYPSITDLLLSNAGFTVPDPTPSPIPAPTSKPVLSIFDTDPLSISLRFKDNVLANPRAKPDGVITMDLYYKLGDTAPVDLSECIYAGSFGRMPAVVTFDGSAGGSQVHFIAVWKTRRNLIGPLSDVLECTIPA